MQFHVTTKHGSSRLANGHMKPLPFLGSGQGAADSMARWGFVSDTIIKAYNKQAKQAPLKAPISNISCSDKINAFVDDTHCLMIKDTDDSRSTHQMLQTNLQIWEKLLHTAGGKLELTKCNSIQFDWQPDTNGHELLTTIAGADIIIHDSETGTPQQIQTSLINEPYKLLGIQMCLNGDTKHQITALKQKCDNIMMAYQRCQMTPEDAWQGYQSIYIPAVSYPLTATAIHEDDLHKIQQNITAAIMPRLGYNRHMSRAVTYAPHYLGGIGLKNLSTEQGIAHIQHIVGNLRHNQDGATTILILLESYAIAAGTIHNPLLNHQKYEYIVSPWIDTTRTFLHQTNSTIDIPHLKTPRLIRVHDREIMELARSYTANTKTLIHINNCRVYLQVTTLAEICNSQGTHILPYAFTDEKDTDGKPQLWTVSQSKLRWPKQSCPPRNVWKHWQRFLQSFTKRRTKWELKRRMGDWHNNLHHQRLWNFRMNSHNEIKHICTLHSILYKQTTNNDDWNEFHQISGNDDNITASWFYPVTPTIIDKTTLAVSKGNSSQIVNRKTKRHSDITPNIGSEDTLSQLLSNSVLQIACISSTEYEKINYTWMVASVGKVIHSETVSADISRNRAPFKGTALGIFTGLQFIINTTQHFHVPLPAWEMHLWMDSRQLINILKPRRIFITPHRLIDNESELIRNIKQRIGSFRKSEYFQPSATAKHTTMRRIIHEACKLYSIHNRPTMKTAQIKQRATLTCNHQEITDEVALTLRHAAASQDLREYLSQKYQWDDTVADLVDWDTHGLALTQLSHKDQRLTIKFIHQWLPLNGHPSQTENRRQPLCPCCNMEDETFTHYRTCPELKQQWTIAGTNTIKLARQKSRDGILLQLIEDAINHGSPTSPTLENIGDNNKYKTLLQEQHRIGWDQIAAGRWSREWVRVYDDERRSGGEAWVSDIIAQQWKEHAAVWHHRCHLAHKEETAATKETYVNKIKALYKLKSQLDVVDRAFLDQPMTQLIKAPERHLRDWYHSIAPFVKKGLQRAKQRMKIGNHSITTFFHPKTNILSNDTTEDTAAEAVHQPKNDDRPP